MITYSTPVLEEWVDYNGHLRDAFYLLIFSYATDAFMAEIGVNPARDKHSLFTLECHLNYLHEVKQGTDVQVGTRIIGHDRKRLHLYHSLHEGDRERPLATTEQMLLHVNLEGPHSAAFSTQTVARLTQLHEAQQPASTPLYIARTITL